MGVDNLKPCPFCGSRVLSMLDCFEDEDLDVSRMVCQRCNARGPYHGDPAMAEALWNERDSQKHLKAEQIPLALEECE